MTLVHVAVPPRNDGSQCCRRCGVELSAANDPNRWPVDGLVQIAVDGDGAESRRAIERQSADEPVLCLSSDELASPRVEHTGVETGEV